MTASTVTMPAVRRLLRPLLVLLALVFLFEAWLWTHLAPIVAFIVAFIPLRALKAAIARRIDALPPAATFVVFIVPVVAVIVPLKFAELWMLAHHHWFGAVAILALAKVVGVAISAFIFDVTRAKLLALPWFRWVYDRVMVWLDWAHELIDPIKRRLKSWFRMWAPKRAGRTLRLFVRIRRRMQATRAAAT